MEKKFFFAFLLAFSGVFSSNSFEISVEEGGYTGLVVSIHRTIPEDKKLIDNLKTMFTKGSAFLYNATGQRLYFKSVTIAIPETWKGDYGQASVFTDYFTKSHVRIAEANLEFGDAPYTLQPGECGEQGEYIHFTPKFVTEIDGWTDEVYGDAGRQLVHEFSHFRFGVFDEYGTVGNRRFPLFYQDGGRILPTSCVQDIKGWAEQENGEPCIIYENGFVGDECRFIPDMARDGQSQHLSSLMYMPFLPTMEGYCQDGNVSSNIKHNWRAPTKQNAFCAYTSTWAVIQKHKDMKDRKSAKADTNPSFNVVRFAGNEARRTVLVMDLSGSMGGSNRIQKLQQAASRFVKDAVPWNSSLAMVEFGTEAFITVKLTQISNSTSRNILMNKVPKDANRGRTAIGKGLKAALTALGTNNTEGATIILITDGEETETPYISEVVRDIEKAKAIVNTIAIGETASQKLENLAIATGGKSFFFPDSTQEASGFDSAFQSSISSQVDVDLQPLNIAQETVAVTTSNKGVVTKDYNIDAELGKNTVFSFRGSTLNSVKISLMSPSSKWYQEESEEFESDLNILKRKKFVLPQAETGKWVVVYNCTANSIVSFSLTSEVKDLDTQPIRASSWFDKVELTYPAYVKVLARVTKGYNVVLNATVKATILRPDGKSVEIWLRDNGAGADAIKDDGIYSSFFKGFVKDGRYAAVATVVNDGKAVIKKSGANYGQVSRAPSIPKDKKQSGASHSEFEMEKFRQLQEPLPEPQFETEQTGDFSRNVDLGNFQLTNYKNDNRDVTEPNRVTDLRVESISEPNSEEYDVDNSTLQEMTTRNITLVWTAAGDDLDEGIAARVEIRGSLNGQNLLLNFDKAHQFSVDTKMVPAGSLQRVTFESPIEWSTITEGGVDWFFALKTFDKAGNKADMSNIAFGHIGYKAPPRDIDDKSSTSKTGLIVGVVIGVLIGIGLIVGIIFYCKK